MNIYTRNIVRFPSNIHHILLRGGTRAVAKQTYM